jgi:tRNA(fMet)-specific endonuclease VapC
MPRYMLDTNICIYIRRKHPPSLRERFERLAPGEVCISTITHGELFYGVEKSDHRTRSARLLEELLSLIPVHPIPLDAAQTYGAIRRLLERRGEQIGGNDLWIAAHAKAAGLTLVTNNEREFRRVPGLKVENWIADD